MGDFLRVMNFGNSLTRHVDTESPMVEIIGILEVMRKGRKMGTRYNSFIISLNEEILKESQCLLPCMLLKKHLNTVK